MKFVKSMSNYAKNILDYFLIGFRALPDIIISIVVHFFIGLKTVITIIPKYFIIGIKYIFSKDKSALKREFKQNHNKKNYFIVGFTFGIYLFCVFVISRYSVQQLKINYLAQTILDDTNLIIEEEVIIPTEINEENNSEEITSNEQVEEVQNVYYPNDYWDYINVPFISVNFDELLQKNSDTVAWIKVNGTNVNYPVVQSTDNSYYLSHAFNKRANSGGWIYGDFRDNFVNFDKNTIIYGHNLYNRTMFGSLVETQKSYWYTNSDNWYIKLSTPTSNTVWRLFSTYTVDPTIDYLRTNFENNSYEEFLNTIKSRSIYNFDIDVTTDDKVLTLSTCNDSGTKRIVVHAKMVSINYR